MFTTPSSYEAPSYYKHTHFKMMSLKMVEEAEQLKKKIIIKNTIKKTDDTNGGMY